MAKKSVKEMCWNIVDNCKNKLMLHVSSADISQCLSDSLEFLKIQIKIKSQKLNLSIANKRCIVKEC